MNSANKRFIDYALENDLITLHFIWEVDEILAYKIFG